jgi:hypothetical protein
MHTEKKETVFIKNYSDFPTLALSRSGDKGVISAQSSLKKDRSTPTIYMKELNIVSKETTAIYSKDNNLSSESQNCPGNILT